MPCNDQTILEKAAVDHWRERLLLTGVKSAIDAGQICDPVGILGDDAEQHSQGKRVHLKTDWSRRAVHTQGCRLPVEPIVHPAHCAAKIAPPNSSNPGQGRINRSGQFDGLIHPFSRCEHDAVDAGRIPAHCGECEVSAVRDAPELDLRSRESPAQIFEIVGAFNRVIARE